MAKHKDIGTCETCIKRIRKRRKAKARIQRASRKVNR